MKNHVYRGFLTAILLAVFAGSAWADSSGIDKLRRVEEKFKSSEMKDQDKKTGALNEMANAIAEMPKDAKAKLDRLQIRELVEALRVSDKYDFYHKVVEHNAELVRANFTVIKDESKKLSPKDRKEILDTIDIVLGEDESSDVLGSK